MANKVEIVVKKPAELEKGFEFIRDFSTLIGFPAKIILEQRKADKQTLDLS